MKTNITGRTIAVIFTLIFIVATVFTGCATVPDAAESDTPAITTQNVSTPSAASTQNAVASGQDIDGVGYISLDVNPSIQLAIKGGVVLGVTAYNDDGEKITFNNNVVGLTYENAIDKLIAALNDGGYLATTDTPPSVVITTYGDVDADVVKNVETQANSSLSTLGLTCPVYASDVSDDIADVSKSYGLTPGRYMLISYLADNEGLTMEEAIAKYSHMRMGDLTRLVGDNIGIYGDNSPLYAGLTDEQIAQLNAAKDAYSDAMHAAAQAYHDAKAAAIDAFKSAKGAAQKAFKGTKDKDAWQQSKSAAIKAFQQAKDAAKSAFDTAKANAKADFMTAVKSLGLDPALIANMLAWDFDYDWNYDYSWGSAPDAESTPQASQSAKPSDKPSAKPSAKPSDKPNATKTPGSNNGNSGNNTHDKNGNKPDRKIEDIG